MAVVATFQDLPEREMAVLRVQGEMDFDTRAEFQLAADRLLGSGYTKMVVDLSKVTRMSSVFIGTLIDLGSQAQQAGRGLSVMMPKKMANVCVQAGLDKVVTILEV